jgi:hypothetical protein
MSYVDAYPSTIQALRHRHSRPTTAKRVQNHISLITRGQNDPFQQRFGLLRLVPQTFLRRGRESDVSPKVLQDSSWGFIQIFFQTVLKRSMTKGGGNSTAGNL